MRKVRSVNASIGVWAKASFTIIAFVENSIAPESVMRNPARERCCLTDFSKK